MSDKPTDFPQPLGGNEMPRFAGPGTMMRLPAVDSAAGMNTVFIGIPLDIGTSNRSGPRSEGFGVADHRLLQRGACT